MLSHRGLGQGLGEETGGRGAAGPSGRVPLGARERLGPPETAGLASAIPLGLLLFRCPRPVGSEPCGHRLRLLLEYLTPVVLHRTSAAERACGVVKQSPGPFCTRSGSWSWTLARCLAHKSSGQRPDCGCFLRQRVSEHILEKYTEIFSKIL